MNLKKHIFPYTQGQAFQHVDGGYYRFIVCAYSSEDQSEKVVYEHVWPFEPSVWERPVTEFMAKFAPITADALTRALSQNRLEVQEEISKNKAQRRRVEQT